VIYAPVTLPFRTRRLPGGRLLAVSDTGDHVFLKEDDLERLRIAPAELPIEQQARLKARFFLRSAGELPGLNRLLVSRRAARRETVSQGPTLHIVVPTLWCGHSCRYCQVSRALDDSGHALSQMDLDHVTNRIFESPSRTLTIEYQGGDPLLRFDLLRYSIEQLVERNQSEQRNLRFVIASTLHQLTPEMCTFLKQHGVYLSTSIDGPAALHNKNRPTPTRDAHERTVRGIELARSCLGPDSVSALMTTTKASLQEPEAIVDEYVRHGFHDIFLRPLSAYGFAKRNQALLGYSLADFQTFYQRAIERVLYWNRQGYALREVYASVVLNKILSPFDGGYVDLQSPTGAGSAVVVYNYDGFIYPSDEARMLAETGDTSLRLGRIEEPLEKALSSPARQRLIDCSLTEGSKACGRCTYNLFCAPNPVDAQAQFGRPDVAAELTEHCRKHLWLFDAFFDRLCDADDHQLDLFHRWAAPAGFAEA